MNYSMVQPSSSAIFKQLKRKYELLTDKQEASVLHTAIQDQNCDAIDFLYPTIPVEAKRIIDQMIAIAWNVPVSSLSSLEEY